MRKLSLLTTAAVLGTLVAAASPAALAQGGTPVQRGTTDSYGFVPPPGTPTSPASPAGAVQNRAAAQVTAMQDDGSAAAMLRMAEGELRGGNTARANEFLERAETRALTRSTAPERAGEPARGEMVQHISAAREALRGNDRALAQRLVQTALNSPGVPVDSATGAEAPTRASGGAIGGGAAGTLPAPAGTTAPARDGGTAGTTTNRADLILVQGGARGEANPQNPTAGRGSPTGPAPGVAQPTPPATGVQQGGATVGGQITGGSTSAGPSGDGGSSGASGAGGGGSGGGSGGGGGGGGGGGSR